MDHSEAVAAGMVERYVLGDLSGTERDAFEEHFFSCELCAADIQAAFDFQDAVKRVGGVERIQGPAIQEPGGLARRIAASGMHRQWGAWAAVLAVTAGYQAFVQIPGLRTEVRDLQQPRLFAGAKVLRMGSRAVPPETSQLHAGQPLHFFLEIPVEPQFQSYEIRVTPPGAAAVITRVPAQDAREPVVMVIPKAVSGTYHVTVSGSMEQNAVRHLQDAEIRVP